TPLRPLTSLLRWWWLVVLVLVLVAAGAVWQDLGPDAPHRYLVRQQVAIVVLPLTGAVANYDIYLARAQEERGARAIVQDGLLRSPPFAQAVAARLTQGQVHLSQRFTMRDVAQALGAAHAGNLVTLVARWQTGAGAAELVRAAAETLIAEAEGGMLSR